MTTFAQPPVEQLAHVTSVDPDVLAQQQAETVIALFGPDGRSNILSGVLGTPAEIAGSFDMEGNQSIFPISEGEGDDRKVAAVWGNVARNIGTMPEDARHALIGKLTLLAGGPNTLSTSSPRSDEVAMLGLQAEQTAVDRDLSQAKKILGMLASRAIVRAAEVEE